MSTRYRRQPWGAALGLGVLLAALLVGCAEQVGAAPPGGGDPTPGAAPIATAAPLPTPAATPPADPLEAALAYGRCIRENGYPEWPDPDAEGRIMIRRGEGGGFNDPRRLAAMEACQALRPAGMGAGVGGGMGQGGLDQEALLAFARCMRDNGVPQFPDPGATGGGPVLIGPGSGIDSADPVFQAALATCRAQLAP